MIKCMPLAGTRPLSSCGMGIWTPQCPAQRFEQAQAEQAGDGRLCRWLGRSSPAHSSRPAAARRHSQGATSSPSLLVRPVSLLSLHFLLMNPSQSRLLQDRHLLKLTTCNLTGQLPMLALTGQHHSRPSTTSVGSWASRAATRQFTCTSSTTMCAQTLKPPLPVSWQCCTLSSLSSPTSLTTTMR